MLDRALLSHNVAVTGPGGAIRNVSADASALQISNSTIVGNISDGGGGGGGISTTAGTVTINNSTIVFNSDTSGNAGGAGGIDRDGGTLNVANSIIALNFHTANDNLSPGAINGTNTSNFTTGDPVLGPLQDNGGPTLSLAPLASSPVIDDGSNAAIPAGVTTDQRGTGFNRILDGNNNGAATVDIGSMEFQPPESTVVLSSSVNPSAAGQAVTFTATVTPTAFGSNNPLTGSVSFLVDGTVVGSAPLTGGTATFTTSALAAGTRTVVAQYSGDVNYTPSSGPALLQEVASGATRNLAVGGSLDGRATVFIPDSGGQYGTPVVLPAVFGTITANVRTAVGDVNGEGFEDTILVTGPGTPIRFAVVSGADKSTLLVASTPPFAGSEDFTGGGFVSAADFDGDGRAEIVVTPDLGGGPRVTILSLNPGGSLTTRANFFGIDDPNFRGGARTGTGDINADGTPDLAVGAGFQGGPRIALFDGTTLTATPTRLVNDFFAFEPDLRNGSFPAIGDLNGDGFGDLFFGTGPGGAPRLLAISGQQLLSAGSAATIASPLANFFVAGNAADRGGVRVATKDADGDNKADLVVASGEGSPANVRVYLGKNFTSTDEPTTFQDVFDGAVLTDGVFVG